LWYNSALRGNCVATFVGGRISALSQLAQSYLRSLNQSDQFTQAESRVLEAGVRGSLAVCGPNDHDDDPANDPSGSSNWPNTRDVRSVLLQWLCLSSDATALVDRRGLRVHGAKIADILDLSYAIVPFPLILRNCHLEELRLQSMKVDLLVLRGSSTGPIRGDGITISGSMHLDLGFHAHGPVFLRNAEITGNFDCQGGRFENPARRGISDSGVAINADGIKVHGYVLLRGDKSNENSPAFRADGMVRFYGAQIEGDLDCSGGAILNPAQRDLDNSGEALIATAARINGQVLLRESFRAEGMVRLYATQIRGELNCHGASFSNWPVEGAKNSGVAIQGVSARIGGSVLCGRGFVAQGCVNFYGAQIDGDFMCPGGIIDNDSPLALKNNAEALQLSTARIEGQVVLGPAFYAAGIARLYATQIRGDLKCDHSTFSNPGRSNLKNTGLALMISAARIGGHVFCHNGFLAKGSVNTYAAQIEGNLTCSGGQFQNPAVLGNDGTGDALQASSIRVGGQVFLNNGFAAEGSVNLSGARIGLDLNCIGADISSPVVVGDDRTGVALRAGACDVGGSVLLRADSATRGEIRRRWCAKGAVRFYGAQIGGDFICDDADISNPAVQGGGVNDGTALEVSAARIGGQFTYRGASAEGAVRLYGAQVNGDLVCGGNFVSQPHPEWSPSDRRRTGLALVADGVRVKGRTALLRDFHAIGTVTFLGAQLDGDFDCSGAELRNSNQEGVAYSGVALDAERVRIGGSFFLREIVVNEGSVRLLNAHVGGDLDCTSARIKQFLAQRAIVMRGLLWKLYNPFEIARLDFRAVKVGSLHDDIDSWCLSDNLLMDGFVYDRIVGDGERLAGQDRMAERLRWLGAQKWDGQTQFAPQPYRQLAKVLREEGDDRGAREVLYRMEARRRELDGAGLSTGFRPRVKHKMMGAWSWALRATIGYGYYPQWALVWLIGLVLLGWVLYGLGYSAGRVVPSNQASYVSFTATGIPAGGYAPFYALIYSVDNSFPLIHLGQSDNWTPIADCSFPHLPPASRNWLGALLNFRVPHSSWLGAFLPAYFLQVFRWVQIVLGWLLATLFVAGISGVTRKD
jgi:hypothetical protein